MLRSHPRTRRQVRRDVSLARDIYGFGERWEGDASSNLLWLRLPAGSRVDLLPAPQWFSVDSQVVQPVLPGRLCSDNSVLWATGDFGGIERGVDVVALVDPLGAVRGPHGERVAQGMSVILPTGEGQPPTLQGDGVNKRVTIECVPGTTVFNPGRVLPRGFVVTKVFGEGVYVSKAKVLPANFTVTVDMELDPSFDHFPGRYTWTFVDWVPGNLFVKYISVFPNFDQSFGPMWLTDPLW